MLASCIREMENSRNVQALREALRFERFYHTNMKRHICVHVFIRLCSGFGRLLLKDRIPEIQNVVVLQSMMRTVGRNSPILLKKELAVRLQSIYYYLKCIQCTKWWILCSFSLFLQQFLFSKIVIQVKTTVKHIVFIITEYKNNNNNTKKSNTAITYLSI